MTPEELAVKLESTIIRANEVLASGVQGVQDYLYTQLVKVLKDLELDDDGLIKQSAVNRKVIEKAINTIDAKIQSSRYQVEVEQYLSVIPQIDALNITYFEVISDAFKPNRQFLASLQKQTVSQLEDLLFNQGFEASVKIPLTNLLNQNINAGGHFTDLLDSVKIYIKGDSKIDGKLLSHTKTVTKSTLFNYSRAFQQAISKDLGLQWFAYSGGLMDKSREFCKERAGHYYQKAEVESWGDLTWGGQIQGTNASNVFVYAGGWNCTHSIIPVVESVVPEEDIQSAKDGGFVS